MSCKMGKETRGVSLEKIHAREESPCRKVEEGRSLVFLSIRKKVLLLNRSEHGERVEGKVTSWAVASCTAVWEMVRV